MERKAGSEHKSEEHPQVYTKGLKVKRKLKMTQVYHLSVCEASHEQNQGTGREGVTNLRQR